MPRKTLGATRRGPNLRGWCSLIFAIPCGIDPRVAAALLQHRALSLGIESRDAHPGADQILVFGANGFVIVSAEIGRLLEARGLCDTANDGVGDVGDLHKISEALERFQHNQQAEAGSWRARALLGKAEFKYGRGIALVQFADGGARIERPVRSVGRTEHGGILLGERKKMLV